MQTQRVHLPRRGRHVLLALLLATVLALVPGAASAQSDGEAITDYQVRITVQADATMQVVEDITYDFGPNQRRGIIRDLVVREAFDGTNERVYAIDDISVRTGPDTPGDVQVSDEGGFRRVRIGDPDVVISGVHRYQIAYTVRGGPRSFPDHDELFWDAVGNLWSVPIAAAAVTVDVPAEVTQVLCFAGPQGSNVPCDRAGSAGASATFAHDGLRAGEGLTVVVGMPAGTFVPPAEPILEELWTPAFGFRPTPVRAGLASLIAIAGVGGFALLAWRHGRDRAFVGSAVDQALGSTTGQEERRGFGRLQAGTVEFVPPDGIRPGQVGTLVDERVNLVDVTATIVDLAVRGWLRIVERPDSGLFSRPDYELHRVPTGGTGRLLGYEQLILDSLFATGPVVVLSELKYRWRPQLAKVQEAIYDDLVAQGWYRTSPERTRVGWRALGILLLILGAAATLFLMMIGWGLVGVAVFAAGVTLSVVANRMPARTAKGTAMLTRVLGFKRLFTEGLEDARARFAEQQGIFSEYLPFAVVFGMTDRWARAFEGLGADQLGTGGWYTGPNAFTAVAIAHAVNGFDTATVGTLYASQPSSSSSSGFGGGGFSGGGGGGGGGSSW